MKKLTALFTVVAMLVCMFAIAPTASAAEPYGPDGEIVDCWDELSQDNDVKIFFQLECNNGWLDGTNGVDFVEAYMSSTESISCTASIDVTATYISDGFYTSESEYDTVSTLGIYGFSVSVYPNTDLLSSGSASYNVSTSTQGHASASLSASCPTSTR